MVKNYLKIAFRNLIRHKMNSAINISGLAVGMAAFIMIALYVKYEYTWDRFHENFNRIYRIQQIVSLADGTQFWTQTPYPLAQKLMAEFPEFEETTEVREIWGELLSTSEKQTFFEKEGYYANPAIFKILSFQFLLGSPETALEEPFSVVLTRELAEKYFGNQNPLGQEIHSSENKDLKVTAVIEDLPENSHIRPTYLVSFNTFKSRYGEAGLTNWHNNSFRTYALLKKNVDSKQVNTKIKHTLDSIIEKNNKHLYLKPLSELHLTPNESGDFNSTLFYFSAIAFFILVLASINSINLTTAQASLRIKEISVRKVVGSSRLSLVKQFLGESVLLSMLALGISFFLVEIFLPAFNSFIDRKLTVNLGSNWPFVLGLALFFIIVGILAGIYPALYLSGFNPIALLKGNLAIFSNKAQISSKGRLRKILIGFQFNVSIVLIGTTLFVNNQIDFMKKKDLGFKHDNLLLCSIPNVDSNTNFTKLRTILLANADIQDVALSSNAPFHGNDGWFINWEGAGADQKILSRVNWVDPHFIDTYQMKIKMGRNFSETYLTDEHACLINETAVRTFGWEDPLGKRIIDNKYTVIGVVQDFHPYSVHERIPPYILFLHSEKLSRFDQVSIKLTSTNIPNSLQFIRSTLTEFFPQTLFRMKFFDEGYFEGKAFRVWEGVGKTFSFFTILAIIIATIGLFGLVSFAVQRRTKEIGIRKVLGASVVGVLTLISKEYLALLTIASILALPLGYLVTQTTPGAYKYQMQLIDHLLPIIACYVIAFLTAAHQSIRAATANPVDSLRYE